VKTAFKALYFLGLLAEIAIRVPHEWRRRATRMEGDRADSLERSLIGLLSVGMLLVPGSYVTIPWLDRSDYRLPPQVERRVGRIGTAFLASALILFWRSHADLGRNWSPSLQLLKDHRLVTGGVYRHVRHPMYASQWLWSIAQILLLQNWIAGWAGAALFLPLYVVRTPREERMMLERFGGEYRAYARRTGRVFPRIARRGR
jgi:protein-S-isoprenylcysteine O-methyltransferase Ste14